MCAYAYAWKPSDPGSESATMAAAFTFEMQILGYMYVGASSALGRKVPEGQQVKQSRWVLNYSVDHKEALIIITTRRLCFW